MDRNLRGVNNDDFCDWSLSARRAWIEILKCCFVILLAVLVALRKESVDRNMRFSPISRGFTGRSPQGERG